MLVFSVQGELPPPGEGDFGNFKEQVCPYKDVRAITQH